jgi:CheY-like chemotaxis protein
MTNILLIDDEAQQGWKEVLEVTVFKELSLDVAETEEEAKLKLKAGKYDLILLDLRFGQEDHEEDRVEQFGGFRILTQFVRPSLESINFPTPVMVFTASNKIWHTHKLLMNGADDYYIKEHPDIMNDIEFSRANYKRFLNSIRELDLLGAKRSAIWDLIDGIQKKLLNSIDSPNVRDRIKDKLKIGYATLFSRTNEIESRILLKSNEILAFLIFWSILEEIVKDSLKDNWIRKGRYEGSMKSGEWIFKNGETLSVPIEDSDEIEAGIKFNKKENYWYEMKVRLSSSNWEYSKLTRRIDLSYQIIGYMLLCKRMEPFIIKAKFNPLRDFRNKTAYTHSSIESILQDRLSTSEINDEAYKKCLEMLRFLDEVIG